MMGKLGPFTFCVATGVFAGCGTTDHSTQGRYAVSFQSSGASRTCEVLGQEANAVLQSSTTIKIDKVDRLNALASSYKAAYEQANGPHNTTLHLLNAGETAKDIRRITDDALVEKSASAVLSRASAISETDKVGYRVFLFGILVTMVLGIGGLAIGSVIGDVAEKRLARYPRAQRVAGGRGPFLGFGALGVLLGAFIGLRLGYENYRSEHDTTPQETIPSLCEAPKEVHVYY